MASRDWFTAAGHPGSWVGGHQPHEEQHHCDGISRSNRVEWDGVRTSYIFSDDQRLCQGYMWQIIGSSPMFAWRTEGIKGRCRTLHNDFADTLCSKVEKQVVRCAMLRMITFGSQRKGCGSVWFCMMQRSWFGDGDLGGVSMNTGIKKAQIYL